MVIAASTLTVIVAVVVLVAAVWLGLTIVSRIWGSHVDRTIDQPARRAIDRQFERPRNEGDLL